MKIRGRIKYFNETVIVPLNNIFNKKGVHYERE